jgi:hypothetical protein
MPGPLARRRHVGEQGFRLPPGLVRGAAPPQQDSGKEPAYFPALPYDAGVVVGVRDFSHGNDVWQHDDQPANSNTSIQTPSRNKTVETATSSTR